MAVLLLASACTRMYAGTFTPELTYCKGRRETGAVHFPLRWHVNKTVRCNSQLPGCTDHPSAHSSLPFPKPRGSQELSSVRNEVCWKHWYRRQQSLQWTGRLLSGRHPLVPAWTASQVPWSQAQKTKPHAKLKGSFSASINNSKKIILRKDKARKKNGQGI